MLSDTHSSPLPTDVLKTNSSSWDLHQKSHNAVSGTSVRTQDSSGRSGEDWSVPRFVTEQRPENVWRAQPSATALERANSSTGTGQEPFLMHHEGDFYFHLCLCYAPEAS